MAISNAFLQEILSKLPATARPAVEAAFDSPDAAEAVSFLDNGVKRQQDYSRHLNDLREQRLETERLQAAVQAKFEEQTAWYDANQSVLDAGRKAIAGETIPPTGGPVKTDVPPDVLRREDFVKEINAREAGVVAFVTASTNLAMRHAREFNEELDLGALVASPQVKEHGLLRGYELVHAEKITAKRATADQARIDAAVADGVRAALASRVANPYPVAGDNSGSPLDVLEQKTPDALQFSAQAAADEYTQLAAKRQATG